MPALKKSSKTALSKNAKKGLVAAGLLAGTALAVGTAFFLKSPQGKKMLNQAERKVKGIQKKLTTEINKQKKLTRDSYERVVNSVLAYYTKSKELAVSEVPEIRKFLMEKYREAETEFKGLAKAQRKTSR